MSDINTRSRSRAGNQQGVSTASSGTEPRKPPGAEGSTYSAPQKNAEVIEEERSTDAEVNDDDGSTGSDTSEANKEEMEERHEDNGQDKLLSSSAPSSRNPPQSERHQHQASSRDPLPFKPQQNQVSPRDPQPSKPQQHQESSPPKKWSSNSILLVGCLLVVAYFIIPPIFSNTDPNSFPIDADWRLKIDPNNHLSNRQQSVVRASLKHILDKSSANQDQGVSTLLILSSNEETAAKLAQCLLQLVNKQPNKDQISAEIDLQKHRGGKLSLDSKLRTLLSSTDSVRAVLLRHIGDISAEEALDQLSLLFAYCDGENPVFPHRLIIMTATSNSENETELRERFKTRWPEENDFVDALMSRISGHTLHVQKDQESIC